MTYNVILNHIRSHDSFPCYVSKVSAPPVPSRGKCKYTYFAHNLFQEKKKLIMIVFVYLIMSDVHK